jgi:hypothetical protein
VSTADLDPGTARPGQRDRWPAAGWHSVAALARFALAGLAVYVAIDVLLAFLRPHLSLVYNAESDYGRGPWYWVMDVNFLLRCALSLAAARAVALAAGPGARLRTGLGLLTAWAVCSGLLAFFADNDEGQPLTASGKIHLLLALIAFVCVTAGTIVISARLWQQAAWHRGRMVLLAVSLAGAASLVRMSVLIGRAHAAGGLAERIFLGLELLWLGLAAYLAASGRLGGEPPAGGKTA